MAIRRGKDIPYKELARKLFGDSDDQRLIPFLGAGVSLSAPASSPAAEPPSPWPDENQVKPALSSLRLEEPAQLFVKFALATAFLMANQPKPEANGVSSEDLLRRLTESEYPPSAGELSWLFSELSSYTALQPAADYLCKEWPSNWDEIDPEQMVVLLRGLVRATGLSGASDSLSSISGYYETQGGRSELWRNLARIFRRKTKPTPTHEVLAAAAARYLSLKPIDDHLIITSNYDCLMEEALIAAEVPYAVLTLRKKDGRVVARFCDSLRQLEERNHCCPVKSRIESIGWGHRGIRLGSRMAGVPVKGAFFRIA